MSSSLIRDPSETDEMFEFRLFCESHQIFLNNRNRKLIYANAKKHGLTPVQYFIRRDEFKNQRDDRKRLAFKITCDSFNIDHYDFQDRLDFFNDNLKDLYDTYPHHFSGLYKHHFPNSPTQDQTNG